MENLLYPQELSKKLKKIKQIAKKHGYNEILAPINELTNFLDSINGSNKENSAGFNLEENKVQILAYYLSRFDHYELFPSLNQNEAFEKIAAMANIKKSTLRLARDYFDSKTAKVKTKESPYLKTRKGIDMPLTRQAQKVFDYYSTKKRTEITKDVLKILKDNNAAAN